MVFDADPRYRGVLLVLAELTMVVGVLGAVGRNGMRDILSFHMVSQNGYLLLGLALFGPLGLAAGIFYTVRYIMVKGSLFLSAGAVETLRGTGRLDRLGGMAGGRPVLAVAFLLAALSLAGIPPLSGFVAKVLLIRAAFTDGQYAPGAIAVAVSFFTLLSMVKIWNGVFWGRSPEPDPVVAEPRPAPIPAVAGGAPDTP
ncbi:MAG TPA: proton-conducting transporter membrane subunit, partial [Frankiaceae bacterium]|nr:proton-conducting transporter membrane subunit [Frankiaceae bacterium]